MIFDLNIEAPGLWQLASGKISTFKVRRLLKSECFASSQELIARSSVLKFNIYAGQEMYACLGEISIPCKPFTPIYIGIYPGIVLILGIQ